jgi:hypothetical protein
MRASHIVTMLAGLALLGCATTGGQTPPSSETLLTASAVVEAVNQETRDVTLRDATSGEVFTVTAGPEVRNLPQLAAGDVVQIDYYDAVTVAMADPADPVASAAALGARAPEGALPGALAVATETVVVRMISYDSNNALATFTLPDGSTRRATVPPELRDFASRRRRGDLVSVTMTEAVAVTITEAGA